MYDDADAESAMKPTAYWVRLFLWVSGIATMLLLAVNLLKGYSLDDSLSESFTWGLVSAVIFTGSRFYHARKNIACALCGDYPPVTGGK